MTEAGIDVVAQAANGNAAIEAVEQTTPDIVVMDLNMPGLSGLHATRAVVERVPSTRVLILTVSAEGADVTEAILAGASGYVLKDAPPDEIVGGVRAAARGDWLISPRVASILLQRARQPPAVRPAPQSVRLSEPELKVLQLLAEGKSVQDIAEALSTTPSVVRDHVSSTLAKLQVDSRVRAPGGI